MVSLFLIYNSDSLIFAIIFPMGGLNISYYHQSIPVSSSRFLVCKKCSKIGFSKKSNIAISLQKYEVKNASYKQTLYCEYISNQIHNFISNGRAKIFCGKII